ncbi:MAG: hypothetical protein HN509_11125 [Halobacteriovoraceae bacterium]|jgi:hypothetical protein|nr:hypothetical protein [Halobacteriovoraceae bacterium]MBT5092855.1 hypothetical protein [Halobacteriovoraceae bacterium]
MKTPFQVLVLFLLCFNLMAKEKVAETKFLAHGHKTTHDNGRVENLPYASISINLEKLIGEKKFFSLGSMESKIVLEGNQVYLNSPKGEEMIHLGEADYITFGGKISEGDGHKYRNINFDSISTIKMKLVHQKVSRHILRNIGRTFAPWTWEIEASAISGVGVRIYKRKTIHQMIEFETEDGSKFCKTRNMKGLRNLIFAACPEL